MGIVWWNGSAPSTLRSTPSTLRSTPSTLYRHGRGRVVPVKAAALFRSVPPFPALCGPFSNPLVFFLSTSAPCAGGRCCRKLGHFTGRLQPYFADFTVSPTVRPFAGCLCPYSPILSFGLLLGISTLLWAFQLLLFFAWLYGNTIQSANKSLTSLLLWGLEKLAWC